MKKAIVIMVIIACGCSEESRRFSSQEDINGTGYDDTDTGTGEGDSEGGTETETGSGGEIDTWSDTGGSSDDGTDSGTGIVHPGDTSSDTGTGTDIDTGEDTDTDTDTGSDTSGWDTSDDTGEDIGTDTGTDGDSGGPIDTGGGDTDTGDDTGTGDSESESGSDTGSDTSGWDTDSDTDTGIDTGTEYINPCEGYDEEGTWCDEDTGLLWNTDAHLQVTWTEGYSACINDGWLMPTLDQLLTIKEEPLGGPTMQCYWDLGIFGTTCYEVWTHDPLMIPPYDQTTVNFLTGDIRQHDYLKQKYAFCVKEL